MKVVAGTGIVYGDHKDTFKSVLFCAIYAIVCGQFHCVGVVHSSSGGLKMAIQNTVDSHASISC